MKKYQFPDGFLWGSGTSAHQVEGHNFDNDWWEFENSVKLKKVATGKACDHFNLFEDDFDLLKSLHQNTYRMSIEWSRIEKKRGVYDRKAIAQYRKMLQALHDRNIKTFVTLHHFTNPLWFAETGGWENPDATLFFKEYVEVIIEELGGLIDFWMTVNEPTFYVYYGYILKWWLPEKFSPKAAKKVLTNMITAHNEVYDLIHSKIPNAQVGSSNIMIYFFNHKEEYLVRRYVGGLTSNIFNFGLFLDKTYKKHDFIGLNYYFPVKPFRIRKSPKILKTDMRWEIYPEGIYHLLVDTWKKYKIPIYITENGLADREDKLRKHYIEEHLKYIHKAIEEGVDVRGYLHWSLLDNYEWRMGTEHKFGLVEVDFHTLERKPRKSAFHYADICKNNGLK